MEIYISVDKEILRLPILPEKFEVKGSNMNQKVNINAIGMINLLGKEDLKEIEIKTFFPAQEYSFVEYKGFPSPNRCVELVEKWKALGKPLRLTITETKVNMEVGIESFSHGIQDGTMDIYYTLELSEYPRIKVQQDKTSVNKKTTTKRPAQNKSIKKTYIVKKGDNLWNIAKRHTGNAMNYKKIAKENNIKNPNRIFPGQKLVI